MRPSATELSELTRNHRRALGSTRLADTLGTGTTCVIPLMNITVTWWAKPPTDEAPSVTDAVVRHAPHRGTLKFRQSRLVRKCLFFESHCDPRRRASPAGRRRFRPPGAMVWSTSSSGRTPRPPLETWFLGGVLEAKRLGDSFGRRHPHLMRLIG